MANVFIRLPSGHSVVILKLLPAGPNYAYGLAKKMKAKLSSVSTALTRLEKGGFVSSEIEDVIHKGSPFQRRVYRLTKLGKDALDQISK